MTATLLAAAWAGVVALVGAGLARAPRHPHRPAGSTAAGAGAAGRVVAQRVGTSATGAAARALGRPAPVPADPAALGTGLLLGAATLAVRPAAWPLGLALGALPPLLARTGRHRAQAAAARAVLDELPEVIDLLGLAVAAGLTAPLAVAAVGRRGHGALAAALGGAAVAAARDGRRLADVLDDIPAALGPAGDGARPLVVALADAARHGTALGPSLDRLAAEARTARRHRAEERARRVPVLLLFPLVTCTLPALGLLTIAPLAVGAFSDLRS